MSDRPDTIKMTELLKQFEQLNSDFENHFKELESASAMLEETLRKIEAGAKEDTLQLKAQQQRLAELNHITQTRRKHILTRFATTTSCWPRLRPTGSCTGSEN